MKKILFLAFLLPACFPVWAQETGMHFEKGLSWTEIKNRAKAENKPILMDCFTTWCGPCKYMDAKVFPTEEAGAYFNDKFILAKVQLDTTKTDNDEIKKWYQDAHDIATDYKVRAYPTYLFFSPDGELIHRAVGSSVDTKTFVTRASAALDPSRQYYTLLKKYQDGNTSPDFLKSFSLAALDAFELETAEQAGEKYLNTVADMYTKDNVEYMLKLPRKTTGKAFATVLANPSKIDEVMGKKIADQLIMNTIINEKMPKLVSKTAPPADWAAIEAEMKDKYASYADEATSRIKVLYFQNKKDWTNFQPVVVDYMAKYGAKASPGELNQYAWTVFENCPDMNCVTQALDWSKRSFETTNNPLFIDTYANILYKMGKKDDAIQWEEKALALTTDENSKKSLGDTLDKMKKGEKTWKND